RWTVAALAVSLVAGIVWLMFLNRPGATEPRPGQTRQLTFGPELELDPALSPDGKMLAYAAGTAERTGIYVQALSGGEPVNLTKDDPGLFHRWPRWSPNNRTIAFLSSEPTLDGLIFFADNFNLEVASYPQGPALKIGKSAMLGHTWSPDG